MRTIEQIRWEIFDLKQKIKDKIDMWYSVTYLANSIWISKQLLFRFYKVETKKITNSLYLGTVDKISLFFKNN